MSRNTIVVQDIEIKIEQRKGVDFFCITDIAKQRSDRPEVVIQNWLRARMTIDFLRVQEVLSGNTDFDEEGFFQIKNKTSSNAYTVSVKDWVETTKANNLYAKRGKYGGTYAHTEVALEFCSWINPAFRLYVIREFQRLKESDDVQARLEWDLHRTLSKINYRVHTDAIKEVLIPKRIKPGIIYASEADLLNMALFGMTAKEWRQNNSGKKGNIRDHATTEQLLVLNNLEAINANYIRDGLSQDERAVRLNEAAITQMRSVIMSPNTRQLPIKGKYLP